MGSVFRRHLKAIAAGLVLSFGSVFLIAADHLDGPKATSEKAADITDVYAWMQDANSLNLIMNVFPIADASSKFSDGILYVFHVNSSASYGAAQTETRVICRFNAEQKVTCWVGDQKKIDDKDASAVAGVASEDAKFKIFTGRRNDPFYFDLDNFNAARKAVRDSVSSLTFDGAGCPTLPGATRTALVATLTGGAGGVTDSHTPGRDFFAALNTLSIVIQADRTLFGAGPVYSVWGSTHQK